MNTSRHHADWLSLVEVSGPFLSLPVLLRVFPQGLDARDPVQAKALRDAYDEWQKSPTAPGRQRGWVLHVLTNLLGYPAELVTEGQTLPAGLEANVAQMGETLRPDFALVAPKNTETAGQAHLIISTYPLSQSLDRPVADRHWKANPATRMTELLHATGVPLGLVTNGEQWMLVYAPRGETTGYASWFSALWLDEPITLRAFHSLLGVHRFFGVDSSNTLFVLLQESAQDQQEVTDQLGYQVREAVQVLIQAFDTLDQDSNRTLLKGLSSNSLYDAALTVMMRLVFLFSAEERGLLHLGKPLYDDNYAVSTLMEQLQDVADRYGPQVLERRWDAWARLLATFRAVHGGVDHQDLMMPAYGGSLFDPDRYPFLEGRPAGTKWSSTPAELLPINNRVVLHLLSSLQRLRVKVPGGGSAEARRVSYRALGVEQIGHVYEGLLDHTAVRASEPVLGLKGTRDNETEIALSTLETLQAKGTKDLIEFLREETGRSEKAIQRALGEGTLNVEHPLLIACGHDESLAQRVRPFAALVREDSFDRPTVILPGSVYVTVGTTRRSTGTHYTPPSLTEPIVQYTLEPLVYRGPAEGLPQEQWQLKSPKEILELKVCDMAMGSGAFLVQACRYLSERLAESWENEEKKHPEEVLITPEGGFSQGAPSERLIPQEAAERLAIGRRIVADRCLYGVDINPMAVEMAKLSMWLITLDAKRPFTFLDHAFKCGDSLLGLSSFKQLEDFSLRPGGVKQVAFSTMNLWRHVEEAQTKRHLLESMPSDTPDQIDAKTALHSEAEDAVSKLIAASDVLVGTELKVQTEASYETELEAAADRMMYEWVKGPQDLRHFADECVGPRKTFHWPLSFPEIIERGGFDAFVGNPPFRASRYLSADFGVNYFKYLRRPPNCLNGQADLCAAFALREFGLLRTSGLVGLIATKTISEGDTRAAFLAPAITSGGRIIWAVRLVWWPGDAQVVVSLLVLSKERHKFSPRLDGKQVDEIDATLSPSKGVAPEPHTLSLSSSMVGKGVGLGADYFLIDSLETNELLNSDCDHVRRFISGSLHNSAPDGWGGRRVFLFQDINTEESLSQLPVGQLFIQRVPETKRNGRFWRYRRSGEALYSMLEHSKYCIIRSQTSSTWVFSFWPKNDVFDQSIIVFGTNCPGLWVILNSSIHETWVEQFGGLMKTDTTYSPTNCFCSFPLPYDPLAGNDQELGLLAMQLDGQRQSVIARAGQGYTQILMQIHDSSNIQQAVAYLRTIRRAIDNAVVKAYRWDDLELEHGFHKTKQGVRYTISETARREVLDRLLTLNQQRHTEEQAEEMLLGKKPKATAKRARNNASKALEEPTLEFETE